MRTLKLSITQISFRLVVINENLGSLLRLHYQEYAVVTGHGNKMYFFKKAREFYVN